LPAARGVVEGQVEATEGLHGLLHQPLDGRGIANVHGHGNGSTTVRRQLSCERLQARRVAGGSRPAVTRSSSWTC
jgi:hypothetical protein